MGKLHTLRRAIERDPERWMQRYVGYPPKTFAAFRTKDGWNPSRWGGGYQKFVKKTLIELGKLPG